MVIGFKMCQLKNKITGTFLLTYSAKLEALKKNPVA
jgi:hypothetical protein